VIGIDTTTTPSCTGVVVVRGTGLPAASFGATGLPIGTAVRLRVDGMAEKAYGGRTAVQLNSDTPGDLPPGDPPS
jgi:hypothetical protein